MKVTCKVIQDLLPLYVDGVCSPDTAALVEEHLKDCEACQEAYHALKEAPASTVSTEAAQEKRDAAVAQGLKKVKNGLRKKHRKDMPFPCWGRRTPFCTGNSMRRLPGM